MTTKALVVMLSVALAGCGGAVYRFTATSEARPPKPPNCEFAISTSPPDPQRFQEIGVLDTRRTPSRRLDKFKEHAAPEVCAAGGDLVFPEVNGYGYYIRAIVYRQTGPH